MNADDERLAELFRLLRPQSGLTQEEISLATSIPVRDIRRFELGQIDDLLFGRIRRLFAEVGARAKVATWWHGAAADRLLDERHASIGERAGGFLARWGWLVPAEFTFSEYGERWAIDLFGHRRTHKSVAVCEVKATVGSLEEMNRTLDTKVRLAPKLCRDHFGWTPDHVGRLLIVPDETTIRRIVASHHRTMDTLYPARGREVRAWLHHPDRSIGGIWFLSNPRHTRTDLPPEP